MIEDFHTKKEKKVMCAYQNAFDKKLYDFVQGVCHSNNLPPLTVGFLSETQLEEIASALGYNINLPSRCELDADAVRHIINRHGAAGTSDHSMENYKDFARLSYVLTNYDEVKYEGKHSHKYHLSDGTPAPHIVFKKRIDGTYYIIEAITDAKESTNHIVTAYIALA